MSTERIKTIDGKQLLNLDFEPIKFIVNGLIPQGLHILAGAPKTGKSWLLKSISDDIRLVSSYRCGRRKLCFAKGKGQ
ncbi:MAG: AAA family ATPase [Ruminococcus sp.]